MDFNVLMCRDIRDCVTPSVAISSQTQVLLGSQSQRPPSDGLGESTKKLVEGFVVDMEAANVAAFCASLRICAL